MNATHGIWCNTRTWPTKCPHCREPVFFFSCDCGSKVFFDDLRDPWPIHDCDTSWTRSLNRMRGADGTITVQLTDGVTIRRPAETFAVEPSILDRARKKRKSSAPDPIVSVHPDVDSIERTVIGILREIQRDADPTKVLRIDRLSTLGAAFLGPLGSGSWSRITVHEPTTAGTSLNSFTVWLTQAELQRADSSKGVTVAIDIAPLQIHGIGSVWLGTAYEVLG